MSNHEQFLDLTELEKSDNSLSSTNVGGQGSMAQTNGKKSKQSKTKSSISSRLNNKKRAQESVTRSSPRSYSLIAGGTKAPRSNRTRPNQQQSEKTELKELKEMMQHLLTLTTQTQMESAVYCLEATLSANMVERLVANNRALSKQVSLLHSAVETLS